jgi:hypothetical protein
MTNPLLLQRRIRLWVVLFVVGLGLSGVTAFPLRWELNLLTRIVSAPISPLPELWPGLVDWVNRVSVGLTETYAAYPFMAYGTDWLAFAHIVIAIAFVGVYREPVRNIWIVEWAMIACLLVFPLALIFGPLRGIPFFWRLIDCSFGLFGIVPLLFCRREIKRLESRLHQREEYNIA